MKDQMAINLSNVRFHYPDKPTQSVLNVPFWTVASGEQVFVHGESGGGKSTLLNLLSGLLSPCEGEVNILGKPLSQMSRHQRDQFRADHIGYVFQQFNLIPYLDAIDNIRLASQFSARKNTRSLHYDIKKLLTDLNLAEKDWQTPARNLSIGQQQRVAIARAMINKPQLLIADEPTSSLDQSNRDAFMPLLMSMISENDMTLLFVSHDMSLANYFSRVEALT
ncbi:ABC transporter ATP-binding protein YbbA [methanotrophic bacterial endosymbiont of Bathymodiolus sp.]|nr:ABC transporter ATP-binding protein YbbA [methanotrophic bacterial endosymbiont of Bathymodiolus sp.]